MGTLFVVQIRRIMLCAVKIWLTKRLGSVIILLLGIFIYYEVKNYEMDFSQRSARILSRFL